MAKNMVWVMAVVAFFSLMPCANAQADPVNVVAVQGKATAIQTPDTVISETRLKTRGTSLTDANKSWVQFDLTAIYAANPGLKGGIASARLTLTGAIDHDAGKSYVVNGLKDSAGLEGWSSSTITWNNAPGNNTASTTGLNTSLTTTNLVTGSIAGAIGNTSSVSTTALTNFLNADTDGKVTFILTPGSTACFYNAGSAYPPTLTLSTVPEPVRRAFPGAEGYGAIASGGRGGVVYEVTNLNDSGEGSLRWAVQHGTTRTVVFRVSGTIYLLSYLRTTYDNLTIAGQTAPGDGITLAGAQFAVNSSNVIVRYIRCRLGDVKADGTQAADSDAIGGLGQDRVIIDHVSASWSSDETFSFYENTNFTAQWCMITESMRYNHHVEEGVLQNHGFGGIWGGKDTSWHHNLLAHHDSRYPMWVVEPHQSGDERNNVKYNWGGSNAYGGGHPTTKYNLVGNYYKWGPASSHKDRIVQPYYQTDAGGNPVIPRAYSQWYVSGNYVDGYPAVTADNWNGGVDPRGGDSELPLCRSTVPFPAATEYPVSEQPAQAAYDYVLAGAGCSLSRDWVDTRIIRETRTRTATYGDSKGPGTGLIDSQTSVGGWPQLDPAPAPADGDHDGMPDAWETANGLSPADATDRNGHTFDPNYTNLEVYINSLCPDPYATDTTPPTPEPMTFTAAPYSSGPYSITMTAAVASDASGVEYYFMCVSGGGHSSGWQDSRTYTDTGLTAGVSYGYRVKARDRSSLHNTTESSAAFSATAFKHACGSQHVSDLDFNCQVDFMDFALIGNTWAGDTSTWTDLMQFANDWLACNRNPAGECWQ